MPLLSTLTAGAMLSQEARGCKLAACIGAQSTVAGRASPQPPPHPCRSASHSPHVCHACCVVLVSVSALPPCAAVYFVQGILGLSRLALSFFFKDDLGVEPAQVRAGVQLQSCSSTWQQQQVTVAVAAAAADRTAVQELTPL
jgi:hypothetical protein